VVTVGVISDTHGLLRPEALAALRGADLVLHAGDVGSADVLEDLSSLGRVVAVRGNVDRGDWARRLPAVEVVTLESAVVYMLHDLHALDVDVRAAGIKVVISGHSHRAVARWADEVLYFNPGSAGPRRFALPVTVGRLVIEGASVRPEIIEIPS
jgi:putative phosphoesterase